MSLIIKEKNGISEEEKILNELCKEISHHDILSFKLDNKSLNNILSELEPFDKKYFHYQGYNFKLQDLSPDLCSFYDVKMEKEKNKKIIKSFSFNETSDVNLIDEDGKRKKINDILSDKNLKISEVLENIMEDVNIFDKIYQEEQNRIENENIKIDISRKTTKNEIKFLYLKQSKEIEKSKIEKPNKIEQEKIYPLEMINKIEIDYNEDLVEKTKNETSYEDLYPLDTYKKKHELKVQLFLEDLKNSQFQSLMEEMIINEKMDPNDSKDNKDIFSVFVVDRPNQEPGGKDPIYIYAGTTKGKIVKILLYIKESKNNTEYKKEILDSKENGINCIDIFENYMVTGHQNGRIVLWENNKIYDRIQHQNKVDIIYLKIIKIMKKKVEIIFSDKLGKVYYFQRSKGIITTENKELLFDGNGNLTYKISFFSIEKDLKNTNKTMILFALTSTKGINFIQIKSKKELKETKDGSQNKYIIKTINSPTGNLYDGIFDSSFGLGFPPSQDKAIRNSIRSSVSGSIVIAKDQIEDLFFVVSFGEIVNLYQVIYNYEKNNKS
jgi:hypothetical protein